MEFQGRVHHWIGEATIRKIYVKNRLNVKNKQQLTINVNWNLLQKINQLADESISSILGEENINNVDVKFFVSKGHTLASVDRKYITNNDVVYLTAQCVRHINVGVYDANGNEIDIDDVNIGLHIKEQSKINVSLYFNIYKLYGKYSLFFGLDGIQFLQINN